MRVPTIQLEPPDKEDEDDEEIPITRPHSAREKATKPNPKGKNIASSPEETRKTRKPHISKVPKRKRKVLSS